ncbi:excalibur calcium-binding domain-containing protein [Mycobacterium sp. PS03-16]|uniref:excalibur calcium-binding domain-containing protein n=1 Tax=Mycobacterium sp. PS03-16 TaxID=2559611 RepID=UPI001073CB26|nr:excalibur calcium-binding domain-containing protein [Mycobacterium sp. PS03-16]TFV55503.1 excalibur calcium-binding domain-containing protein [Mycobacterium sp. PS03-16]
MKKTLVGFVCAGVVAPLFAVASAPVAGAYSSCADARAAGAAPLYAGQPGYSRKLDRDGDGVACETGGGGGGPVFVPAAPVPVAPAQPAPSSSPAPVPASGAAGPNVVVDWTGTDCIDITVPAADYPSRVVVNRCGGHAEFTQDPPAKPESLIGADPAMGSAATVSCEIREARLLDSGVAGDGHDVNCLTTVGQLS